MSYEVLVEELRSAAGRHRDVVSAMGDPVPLVEPDPQRIGHVELAAWLGAVREQCHQAHEALRSDTSGLADSLDVAAQGYESTDQCVAQSFTPTFGQPFAPTSGQPFGAPWSTSGPGTDR